MDKILQQILNVQSESYNSKAMHMTIRSIVQGIPGCRITENNGNIYITKGKAESYNCIVAHTDTVHRIIPQQDYKVIELEGRVFAYDIRKAELTGVGADDKVGIAIALQALRQLPVLKVVLFRDEEVGGIGSGKVDMKWFSDCNYVLQCDRKGNKGIVSNIYGETMFDKEFGTAIAPITDKWGYKEIEGMFTDVYQLVCNRLEVACANIECGYYNPHCNNEYIVLADYERCKTMVLEILGTVNQRFEVDRSYQDLKAYPYDWYDNDVPTWNGYHDWCWECSEYKLLDEVEMLCGKCMAKYNGEVEKVEVTQVKKTKQHQKPMEMFQDLKWH